MLKLLFVSAVMLLVVAGICYVFMKLRSEEEEPEEFEEELEEASKKKKKDK